MARKPWDRMFRSYYAGGLVKVSALGSTLRIDEQGFGPLKRSVLFLTDVVLPIVSVTTGNGVGGVKLADFPGGRIIHFGSVCELSVRVATAKQADFTDATPEGDLGLGILAPANADALGTDETDDNLATAAAFTMASYADASVTLPPEALLALDGHTTAVPIVLTGLVDAADIDDGVTTEVLVSGRIDMTWINLGDHA